MSLSRRSCYRKFLGKLHFLLYRTWLAPMLKCPRYGSQVTSEIWFWECSPSESGKSREEFDLWPKAGVKINQRIFDRSPNPIRGNVSKCGKGSVPVLFSDSAAPGQRSWFKFPNIWYSRKKVFSWRWYVAVVETRTRANLIWSGDLKCKSMFKGQRSNVVSTAPGAVGENLQCGNARLQGGGRKYCMDGASKGTHTDRPKYQ